MLIKRFIIAALLTLLMLVNLAAPALAQAPVSTQRVDRLPGRSIIVTPVEGMIEMDQEPLPPAPVTVKIEGIVSSTYTTLPGQIVVDGQEIIVTSTTLIRPAYAQISVGTHVVVQASWDGVVKTATYIRVYQDGGVANAIEFRGMITELPADPTVGSWIVAGHTVIVTDVKAPVGPPPALGYYAHVVGSLLADQSVHALSLEVLRPDQIAGRFEFEGVVDQVGDVPGHWIIGGVRGWVDEGAQVPSDIAQGVQVQVLGYQTTSAGLVFDQIIVPNQAQEPVFIAGQIQEIEVEDGYGYWRVGGQIVEVDELTFIDESRARAAIGMWAEVVALPGGSYPYALRIRVERPE